MFKWVLSSLHHHCLDLSTMFEDLCISWLMGAYYGSTGPWLPGFPESVSLTTYMIMLTVLIKRIRIIIESAYYTFHSSLFWYCIMDHRSLSSSTYGPERTRSDGLILVFINASRTYILNATCNLSSLQWLTGAHWGSLSWLADDFWGSVLIMANGSLSRILVYRACRGQFYIKT